MPYKMNRLLPLTLLSLSLCTAGLAQTKPTTKQNPPATQPAAPPPAPAVQAPGIDAARFLIEQPDTANENRLVSLALGGPEYDASTHQTKINELELKRTKQTWLNLLTLSSTYNDQSFKSTSTAPGQPTYVYPKYFFGITIPLGVIVSQGTQVKEARQTLAFGKDQQEQLSRRIRADVLTKYAQYKYYASQLELQAELINDVLANTSQAEDNFRKGTITVETYIATQKAANDEIARNMNLKLQQDLIRIELERIIGLPLNEVIHRTPIVRPRH
jgi:outer membrane protein TolC